MQQFKINTKESGGVVSCIADTFHGIIIMNVLEINTDQSTFDYNAETGEITILRNAFLECNGKLNLINTDDETPNTEIWLCVNFTPVFQLFSGVSYNKNLGNNKFTVLANDIITLQIKCDETIELETESDESSFTLTRLLK